MNKQPSGERTDKLRSQTWRHLELGQWHSAALLAEHMCEIDPLSKLTGLAEATRALAMIAEAVRLDEPIDPYVVVRLEEIGRTWPRLGAMRSFKALVQAVEGVSARGQETQSSPSASAAQRAPAQARPSEGKPKQGLLRQIAKLGGCAGFLACTACVLVVVLISRL